MQEPIRSLLPLGFVAMLSCASGPLHPPMTRPEGTCTFDANNYGILCGTEQVVRITCHEPRGWASCRALAVDYVADGTAVWLYKPGGYDPAHPEMFRPPDKDVAFARYAIVASDGEYIWFFHRTSVVSGRGWVRYGVFDGGLIDVSREDIWRLWLAIHDRRAVWLDGKGPPEAEVWGPNR